MKLRYWPIARNIVRCRCDMPVSVVIRPYGKFEGSSLTRYSCNEFNMSATIACTSEIFFGDASATIQWQGGTLVKASGNMAIEIERCKVQP